MKRYLQILLAVTVLLVGLVVIFEDKNASTTIKDLEEETTSANTSNKKEETKKKKMTVYIDPGHGEIDAGTISYKGTYEKDINLVIAKQVGKILQAKDVNVVYSRTTDEIYSEIEADDMQHRIDESKEVKATYVVSIHCNASDDGTRTGVEAFTNTEDDKAMALSTSIMKELEALKYTNSNGIIDGTNLLHMISFAKVPTTLVELGYIDTEHDGKYIMSKVGQNAIAKAIANGVLNELKKAE
ncbi:hypothetical protein A4S06_11485 [Erysipelotrichaceae bacterium MTC7]|nr:hypothetical protein A4S06_11485 [Erysipelotrichaceae bacterium MTC7]